MLAIIDYGMGNVASVKNALDFLKIDSTITRNPAVISKATHLLLPGVGAYREGMKRLTELGLISLLEQEVLQNRKPFLGICLGMQLLTETGEENGTATGLGWVKGTTTRFAVDEQQYSVPHIGWNDITPKEDAVLFKDTEPNNFYFVHSYIVVPEDQAIVSATCDHGGQFTAALQIENIYGVQFHPERSQKSGLTLLKNFAAIAHA